MPNTWRKRGGGEGILVAIGDDIAIGAFTWFKRSLNQVFKDFSRLVEIKKKGII